MPLMVTMRNLVRHVVDAVVGARATDPRVAVLNEPRRAGEQRRGQAVVADGRAELGDRKRTLLVLRQVFLARPDHLHRLADLLGDLGRLTGDPRAAAAVAAEAAAQEHGVGKDDLRIDLELVGNQSDCHRLILRRRPDVDAIGLHMHRRVDRLHAGMGLERPLV